MTVASILDEKGRNIIALGTLATVTDALDLLKEKGIGVILITHDDGSIAGILSERDIVRSLADKGSAVLDDTTSLHMTKNVVTCTESDAVTTVMGIMSKGRFRHLPVTRDDKLIGVISIGDVVKRRIEVIEKEAEDIRNYIATV